MSNVWELWKQGFTAWESATAQYVEKIMTNPSVLGPAGAMLTAAMKTKAATDKAVASWWSAVGLPTRRDQERTLHLLNQLETRLYDLEEQLADARARNANATATPSSPGSSPGNSAARARG